MLQTLKETVILTFGMYTKIPLPQVEWTEENMQYAMTVYPLTGFLCSILCLLSYVFCNALGLSGFLFAALVLLLTEVGIIGGIHWDGFCDTMDAISSHQEREKKLKILKDPNAGAFAVIYGLAFFIMQAALFSELYTKMPTSYIAFVALSFVLARVIASIGLITITPAHKSGLGVTFGGGAKKATVLRILYAYLVIIFVVFAMIEPILTIVLAIMSVIYYFIFKAKILKEFGGMSGDMVGYFITTYMTIYLFILVIAGVLL